MEYVVRTTKHFDKGVERMRKLGKNMEELKTVLALLRESGTLPEEYNPHLLHERFAGYWEAHIEADWLIVWRQNDYQLTIILTDTGTHFDLFGTKS